MNKTILEKLFNKKTNIDSKNDYSYKNKLAESNKYLYSKFNYYKTCNLKKIPADDFIKEINSRIGEIDAKIEGYNETEIQEQRDLSIKFHWGHNHDFGDLKLEGRMGNRHIEVLSNFICTFDISFDDFDNKCVFDIGCWTGGTSLMLAALGSNVYAIEEVVKYCNIVNFISKSFDIENRLKAAPYSLYECNSPDFHECFDIAYFPGVIYHLSDPVIALRIIYNSLKMNGIILIESGGININEPYCSFEGSKIYSKKGTENGKSRGGWNWFKPSPQALNRMMIEAGFDDVKTLWNSELKRVYGYGKKTIQKGICKAGLSIKNIK